MNVPHQPESVAARVSLALIDSDRRRVNAETITRFTLDDLTEARAQLEAAKARATRFAEQMELSQEEARTSRIRLDKLAHMGDCARELARSGRVGDAITMLGQLIELAGSR